MSHQNLQTLSDEELEASLRDSVIDEQQLVLLQLDTIGELDRRKHFKHYPSLWAFLIHEYGMEDWLADRKIRAARTLRRYPELRAGFINGKLNISLLELALGCASREDLDREELLELIDAISGMSCRKAKKEIACRYPNSRELPRDRILPLTAEASELRCVISEATVIVLEDIRGLLAHSHPEGKLGDVLHTVLADYYNRWHPEARARRAEARKARREQARYERAREKRAQAEQTQTRYAQTKRLGRGAAHPAEPSAPRVTEPFTALGQEEDETTAPSASRVDTQFFKESASELKPAYDPTAAVLGTSTNDDLLFPRSANPLRPAAPRVQAQPNHLDDQRLFSQTQENEMILTQGYSCKYRDPKTGKLCGSRHALQKDHIQCWADGGKTVLLNARFYCRNHHRRVTWLRFGDPPRATSNSTSAR